MLGVIYPSLRCLHMSSKSRCTGLLNPTIRLDFLIKCECKKISKHNQLVVDILCMTLFVTSSTIMLQVFIGENNCTYKTVIENLRTDKGNHRKFST